MRCTSREEGKKWEKSKMDETGLRVRRFSHSSLSAVRCCDYFRFLECCIHIPLAKEFSCPLSKHM